MTENLRFRGAGSRRLAIAGMALSLLLGACANQGNRPPKPLPPLSRIAVLTVVLEEDLDEPDHERSWGMPPVQAPMRGADGRLLGSGDIMRASIALGVFALVDRAIRSRVAERAARLADAESTMSFDPVKFLNTGLRTRLEGSGLVVEFVPDSPAIRTARIQGRHQDVANGADAVLDIRVGRCCYSHSRRAGGLAPDVEVEIEMFSPVTGEGEGDISYEVDWKEDKDPRVFAAPANLIFADPADLVAHADVARQGLEAVLEKLMDKIVADIKFRAEGHELED